MCHAAELLGLMFLPLKLAGSNKAAGLPNLVSAHVLRGFGGWGLVIQLTIVTLGEEAACIVRAVSAGEAAHCGGVALVKGFRWEPVMSSVMYVRLNHRRDTTTPRLVKGQ